MPKTTAKPLTHLDGAALLAMFQAATALLEGQVEAVNALNVYPVPDGDTGTNMLLTMRSALEEADKSAKGSASEVAAAMAKGSLMGARGNSGVILSQILRGLSKSVQGKERLTGQDIASGLEQGSAQAYAVVTNPTEGTILTVAREASAAGKAIASTDNTPAAVLQAATSTAKTTVARTPFMLEILRQNGVVDAGGQGLAYLFEGALAYLQGKSPAAGEVRPGKLRVGSSHDGTSKLGGTYGYCTEFLVERCTAKTDQVQEKMLSLGDSVIVVGDGDLVKVHLHTKTPEAAEAWLKSVATIAKKKIDDIDAQHVEYATKKVAAPQGKVGVVAVVSGEGLANIFLSLGATAIVPGGQTMNPSAQEILKAVRGAKQETVIVLPNNSNVIPAAKQAAEMEAAKKIVVVPTVDLPQGVAAMMGYNFEAESRENAMAMQKAVKAVKTGEVTRAVRNATVDGVSVRGGQAIGMTAGKLVSAGDDIREVVGKLVKRMGTEAGSAVTLYYGAAVSKADAEAVAAEVRKQSREAKVEAIAGGQPHYHYLIAIE